MMIVSSEDSIKPSLCLSAAGERFSGRMTVLETSRLSRDLIEKRHDSMTGRFSGSTVSLLQIRRL